MKNIKLLICFLSLMFILSSCLTTRQTNLLQKGDGKKMMVDETSALKEYRICPGDVLYISVMSLNQETNALFSIYSRQNNQSGNNSGLSSFKVYPDGTIDFPYLPDPILVKGKTTLEVKLLLEDKLQIITKECAVQVTLSNRFFSVIGEAGVGRYDIVKEKTTIFQALAQSGDIHPYGDRSKVKIIRQTEDGTTIKTFDVKTQDIINSEFYYIQPNDVIYVQPLGRQFWGINSFGAVFAFISTVTSVGLLIYNFVK